MKRINIFLLIISIAWGIFLGYSFLHRWIKVRSEAPRLEIFKTSGGWGYNVKYKDRIVINQPTVPVIAYKASFPSEESAKKAGSLVIKKINRKESPALTSEDLLIIVPELMKKK